MGGLSDLSGARVEILAILLSHFAPASTKLLTFQHHRVCGFASFFADILFFLPLFSANSVDITTDTFVKHLRGRKAKLLLH